MENRNNSNSDDRLGVNKVGKTIRKSPLHQPNNSLANSNRQQPQPQVYNINKNDFRNVVQQLTGSPAREPNPRPVNNSPKPQSQRLQRIRPPPLTPINRPSIHHPGPNPGLMGPNPGSMGPNPGLMGPGTGLKGPGTGLMGPGTGLMGPGTGLNGPGTGLMGPGTGPMGPPMRPSALYGNSNAYARPPSQFGQPMGQGANVAESPVSMYMRYLQNSIIDTGSGQMQPQFGSGAPGLLHTPPAHQVTSPRIWGPPPLLPSPNSQFLLPSPAGFMGLMSPRSPYPLLSPGYQFPPPLSPGFGFPPLGQTGILGPGPQQPPVSPGISFPLSPGGFFPVPSPRWSDQK